MKNAEKMFLEEVSCKGLQLQQSLRGMSIGQLIRMIRKQLGMSQKILCSKAKIPQPTLSKIERKRVIPNIDTLEKILDALCCDLIIAPVLRISIKEQRRIQAYKVAKKHVEYLRGTMSLEGQETDSEFSDELIKEKEKEFMESKKLWEK